MKHTIQLWKGMKLILETVIECKVDLPLIIKYKNSFYGKDFIGVAMVSYQYERPRVVK